MIPLSKPSVGKEELSAVNKVFDSDWLGMGSIVFEFEKQLAQYIGAENVIAVNSGTSALHIALDSFGIEAGDEVIVPSLTFVSTIQAIISCDAHPVFCEIEADTLNIDVRDVLNRITPRVKAILPVHYAGLPCKMDELLKIAGDNDIVVIEDAAHAFGSTYKGRKIGSFGDATCFSFDPIKTITCGEGGAVVVKDNNVAQSIIRKRILGIDKDTWHRYKEERSWFYEVVTPGYRYHMSNINAAIGLVQLKKLDMYLKRRRTIVKRYDEAFKDLLNVELLYRDYEHTAPFNYVIKIIDGQRDALLEYLKKNGIVAGVNYIPNHLQPIFSDYRTELPVTEKVWHEIISLPLYYQMSDKDAATVINQVRQFFK